MSVTLKKVTNIGLKITDDLSIPLLKAVVSIDGDGYLSSEAFTALKQQIYDSSIGMVSFSSIRHGGALSPFYQYPGTYTYGESTGFNIVSAIEYIPYYGGVTTVRVQLLYNGSLLFQGSPYTGHANVETLHGVIYVTERNTLCTVEPGSQNLGVYALYSTAPAFTTIDDVIPCVTVTEGTSLYYSMAGTFADTGYDISNDITNEIDPTITDPFSPGGTTGGDSTDPEGGDGTFENEEVTVDPPALPSLSAIQSGFIAAYMPSYSQLQSLGDYLWSDLFSLDTFKKLFSDPMQAILGLSLVPVAPSTASSNVVIGNINTGISMPKVLNQFVTVDCGSVAIPEYWGGYLDYSPYTKVEIYLPYIGVRPLDTDEVMGRTLRVVYNVDVLSGACVCFVQCDNTIRYHYVGQCGASIPITANDWTRVVNGAVSIATALGVGVATLGAGAAAGGATAASMAGTGALVGGIASQVLASKPRVEHSGSLAGMGGLLGVQFPYIIIQRPRQAVPEQQNSFTGYPTFIRRTLSTVSGYTQVTGVHLTGLSCTDEEKNEIQAYLEAGVIL